MIESPKKESHIVWKCGDKEFDLNVSRLKNAVKEVIANNKNFLKSLVDKITE